MDWIAQPSGWYYCELEEADKPSGPFETAEAAWKAVRPDLVDFDDIVRLARETGGAELPLIFYVEGQGELVPFCDPGGLCHVIADSFAA
jgi:hypothetical protein